jgi:hypothetical protein
VADLQSAHSTKTAPEVALLDPWTSQIISVGQLKQAMFGYVSVSLNALLVFYLSLSASVTAADQDPLVNGDSKRRGYSKGELIPVSCLNRTM